MRDSNSARGTWSGPTVATAVDEDFGAALFELFAVELFGAELLGAGAPRANPSATHAVTTPARIITRVRWITFLAPLPFPGVLTVSRTALLRCARPCGRSLPMHPYRCGATTETAPSSP